MDAHLGTSGLSSDCHRQSSVSSLPYFNSTRVQLPLLAWASLRNEGSLKHEARYLSSGRLGQQGFD